MKNEDFSYVPLSFESKSGVKDTMKNQAGMQEPTGAPISEPCGPETLQPVFEPQTAPAEPLRSCIRHGQLTPLEPLAQRTPTLPQLNPDILEAEPFSDSESSLESLPVMVTINFKYI